MSDEMKLLMALCDALGFDVKQEVARKSGGSNPLRFSFTNEYKLTKRQDESHRPNQTDLREASGR